MKIPAIVLARGGSKRLPRKNILPFCGLPLVAWSLIQANCSHYITDTYLSTDDDEIETIGREYGAKIIRRPDWPNPDELSATPIFKHAVLEIEKQYDYDTFVPLLPTAPVRKPNDLDDSIKLYNKMGCITVNAMYNIEELDLYKKQDEYHCLRYIFNKSYKFLLANGIWAINNKKLFLNNCTEKPETDKEVNEDYERRTPGDFKGEPHYYLIEWFQQYDIDYKDDFELCEMLMERYILKGRGKEVYEEYAAKSINI